MSNKKIPKLFRREVILLDRSSRLLSYRRLNWRIETHYKIYRAFEEFVNEGNKAKYPFRLYVSDHEIHAEGTVQITAETTPTGAVNRKVEYDENLGEKVRESLIVENGGELVASLSVSGYVAFILHPRKSERIKPKEKQIILIHRLDPTDVTDDVLEKVFYRYLLYLRSTSLIGMHNTLSIRERIILIWMKLVDIRSKYKISRNLISMKSEWAKLIMAGFLGGLVAYLVENMQ